MPFALLSLDPSTPQNAVGHMAESETGMFSRCSRWRFKIAQKEDGKKQFVLLKYTTFYQTDPVFSIVLRTEPKGSDQFRLNP
jgi:hypothetical protein